MKLYNKNILIWIIIILAVTNISTIGTIIYNAHFRQNGPVNNQSGQIQVPNDHLGRFFRDELNLTYEQHQQFRVLRQKFHSDANAITDEMQVNRNEIMFELKKSKSDTAYLHMRAKDIGKLHEELKHKTFEYYLGMKNICNDEQKRKLFMIFSSMSNSEGEIKMPNNRQNNFQK